MKTWNERKVASNPFRILRVFLMYINQAKHIKEKPRWYNPLEKGQDHHSNVGVVEEKHSFKDFPHK